VLRNQLFFSLQANLLCGYDLKTSFFADAVTKAHDFIARHYETNSKSRAG
jgi:hypothetical protein